MAHHQRHLDQGSLFHNYQHPSFEVGSQLHLEPHRLLQSIRALTIQLKLQYVLQLDPTVATCTQRPAIA